MAPELQTAPEKKNGDGEQQQALAKAPNVAMTKGGFSPTNMEEAWRFSNALAKSSFVPERYRGKPEECLIALDLSGRLQTHWLAVMQHCYQVHGQPGLDANITIGLVNQSGKFEPIQYEVEGGEPKNQNYRVRAFSRRIGSQTILHGPWIDWPLVNGEGWMSKPGSKWKTMPEQMFHYRAGSWWQKRHCPEMTLGMPTTDELYDAGERIQVESKEVQPATGNAAVKALLKNGNGNAVPGAGSPEVMPPDPAPSSDPTPGPVSTGEEGSSDPTTTSSRENPGTPTTAPATASTDKPKTNGKPKLMYRCRDDDCGATFDTPRKITRGKKAGTAMCPQCASENIEPVMIGPGGEIVAQPPQAEHTDAGAALDAATKELEQQQAQDPPKMQSACLSNGCLHQVPETVEQMKGKPCPKCGSRLGFRTI